MKQSRRHVAEFLIFVVAIGIAFGLTRLSLFKTFELHSLDSRFRARNIFKAEHEVDPRIYLIAADDYSLRILGQWPLPRNYYAMLLQFLAQLRPAVIGFDIQFPAETTPNEDRMLVAITRLLKNVCYGISFRLSAEQGMGESHQDYAPLETQALRNVSGDISRLPEASDVNLPFPELNQVAQTGFLNAPRGNEVLGGSANDDGIIRTVPLVIRFGDKLYPSLSLKMVAGYLDASPDDIQVRIGQFIFLESADGKQVTIPIDRWGRMLINYVGSIHEFSAKPLEEFMKAIAAVRERKPPHPGISDLAGKLVFVAPTATGVDIGPTPLSSNSPLVIVQMNAVNTILQENFISRPGRIWGLTIMLLLGLIVAYLNLRRKALQAGIASVAILVVYLLAALVLFISHRIWLDTIAPSITVLFTLISLTTYKYISEEREKRWIKRVFKRYLPANVMDKILADPSLLRLGGERRCLTVLFSDIQKFTSFCESREPEEIVAVLTEYMDRMTEIVFKHNGTLDKYVGDAIMAFWGAPQPDTRHAYNATCAALEMIAALKELQEKWKAAGITPLDIGIGINTGTMLIGNMGSSLVFDYTVIGDEVNIGARVEGLTRSYQVPIIITESTYQEVRDLVEARKLDVVKVKGKEKSIVVYELVGLKADATT